MAAKSFGGQKLYQPNAKTLVNQNKAKIYMLFWCFVWLVFAKMAFFPRGSEINFCRARGKNTVCKENVRCMSQSQAASKLSLGFSVEFFASQKWNNFDDF